MGCTMRVSDTLTVTATAGHAPAVIISRSDGGLVRVEPGELVGLVAVLRAAAAELALALERLERGNGAAGR